ncbi:MAG: UDP-N-acetylmuramate--L-alanine ligase [Gammaproteobacteria bacterium]|nr:UDP-N-acetylmuramate--L-alanine ligase [Gammaproteobacteria bacterium]
MGRVQHIHFVGIGGAGMSGIAEVLHNLGYRVSGSDRAKSAVTDRLAKLGLDVRVGHDASALAGCDVVVRSSAIADDNPEIQAAIEQLIPVVPRAEMLAELMRFRFGVAVAGTHGKTTVTSLVTTLLAGAGFDPTYIIGGRLNSTGVNAQLGSSRFLVAEADESDASFLYLQPMLAVVTNIDADHMATYGNDFGRLRKAFIDFLHHLPFYGQAVVCVDDPIVAGMLADISRPLVTYGLSEDAEVSAHEIRYETTRTHFAVRQDGVEGELRVTLNLSGAHNVRNALAAIAVARELGVPDESIQKSLAGFAGIARRFQVYGDRAIEQGRIFMIDDYGHHPSEVRAVLNAIRSGWNRRRLVMIFQPHRYSRTHDLFEEFVKVLSDEPDVLILLDVYPAGEAPIAGAETKDLSRAIRARGRLDPILTGSMGEIETLLPGLLRDGDVLLTMGAGDVGNVAVRMAELLPEAAP